MKRLQDIADQVGVSRTTVSNVLHGNTKKVSKEMIRKISEILNQEGYVPDTSSRELTRKGSCIIGLVLGYNCIHGIPSLRDTFVAEFLSGVEETAHRNGYYVMLINGHDQNTDRVAEIASRWNVDGLVVLGLDEQKYKELRRQLNKYMVLIDTYPEAEYHYVNVGTDDFGGGAMIAKYLLDNGYTQAIFAAECDTGADHYRWKGFQHQMRSAGIDCGEERHILLPEDLSLRRVMYGHYLDCFVQAGAVALASDYDAAEVMNYLEDHGIQVPEQVSVTGFDDCIYAELMIILLGLVCLLPLLNIVAISFSSSAAVEGNMVGLIPVGFSTAAYEKILEDSQFWHSFLISVERVVLTLIINFVLIVLMAYPLSKTNAQFRGRNIYANLMIFAMLFNGGMIPTFLLVKSYGLLNTVWALVLPGAVPIFNVILVMNFFAAVPKELEEAAFIDGANPLQVLTKIFIPISKPVLATVSLFSIVGSWNDFYSGLIYMSKAAYYPLMTYIQSLQINVEDLIKQGNLSAVVDSASLGNTNLNAAKIVVAVIPLLLIYPLLQRYFVSGIVVGSVKG